MITDLNQLTGDLIDLAMESINRQLHEFSGDEAILHARLVADAVKESQRVSDFVDNVLKLYPSVTESDSLLMKSVVTATLNIGLALGYELAPMLEARRDTHAQGTNTVH